VPWLAVADRRGGCYFGWAFSGYGRFDVARRDDRVLLRGGLDPGYFRHWLQRGEALAVPSCLLGVYSGSLDDGLGEFHNFLRTHWLASTPDPLFPRVQYNTWCSLGMKIDEQKVLQQMEAAHRLGVELFHLDAGWYTRVGDWQPDPHRFPHGLKFLADRAHRLGMKFGLWVAWTQAGPQLARRHPEWLDQSNTRPADYGAENVSSRTLCLGHGPFRQWVKRELARIIDDNRLDYLEFDGRMVEACHRADHTHQDGDGNYAAAQGLYEVLDWLRARYPKLLIEDCCDGGRMLDYGILRRAHLASLSDLYRPADNRRAAWGASFPFPPQVGEAYMMDQSFDSRTTFRSSMIGVWSISADVTRWQPAKFEACRAEIDRYRREIRPLLRAGRVRHIASPAGGLDPRRTSIALDDPAAGRGALFTFRTPADDAVEDLPLGRSLAGIQESASYQLRWSDTPQAPVVSGTALKTGTVHVNLERKCLSAIVTWERLPAASDAPLQ
jgi:alpha-galactosidase